MSERELSTTKLVIYTVGILFLGIALGILVGSKKDARVVTREKIVETPQECQVDEAKWIEMRAIDTAILEMNSDMMAITENMFDTFYYVDTPKVTENINAYNKATEGFVELEMQRTLLLKELPYEQQ